jgi:hypothetical protein
VGALLIGCGALPGPGSANRCNAAGMGEFCDLKGQCTPTGFVCTTNVAIDDEVGSICATKASGESRCWSQDGLAVGDLGLPDAPYKRVQDATVGPIGLTSDGRLFGPPGAVPTDLPAIVDFRATNLWGFQGLCLKAQDGRFFYGDYRPDAHPAEALQVDVGPVADIACAYEGLVCAVKADGTTFGPTCPAGGGWVQVSISLSLMCGLTQAGEVMCSSGVIPDGARVPAFTGGPYRQIATAYQAVCALDASGALTCARSDGAPVAIDPGPYTSIVAGRDLVCGIRPGGTTACFRQNDGAGTFGGSPTFTAFAPIAPPIDGAW